MGKKLRFNVGDRVTIEAGPYLGARGRIARRGHSSLRPLVTWWVAFDEPYRAAHGWRSEAGVGDRELGAWTVHPDNRPVSVGALQHPMRVGARR